MPVNLKPPDPSKLLPVKGLDLGVAEAGIRKANRKDLLVMKLGAGARVAGVFTQNRFCAAPVVVARQHLTLVDPGTSIRALVVNTGNANAGTGKEGLTAARQTCADLAKLLNCAATQVLPFSTGVIMEQLPAGKIAAGLPACLADARPDNWFAAAQAIMTTDTMPKAASRRVRIGKTEVTITGIAKGAGMIHPNMATMLGFIATDAKLSLPLTRALVAHAADRSFNCITVDGDTSTNDSFMLIATGAVDMPEVADAKSAEYQALADGVRVVAAELAQAIIRDGEGATKFITVRVEGGRKRGGMPSHRLRHRAFAAGENRVLRLRSQPRAHTRRGGLCRRRGPGGGHGGPLSRRCAGGEERRAKSRLPRSGRGAGDEADGDHGAGRPQPGRCGGHALDLRPVARLCDDQRRIPDVKSAAKTQRNRKVFQM